MTRETSTSTSVNPLLRGIGLGEDGGARPGVDRERVRPGAGAQLHAERGARPVVVELDGGERLRLHEDAADEHRRGARAQLAGVEVYRQVVRPRDQERLLGGAVGEDEAAR